MLPLRNRLKLPTHWSKTSPDFQLRTDLFKILGKEIKDDQPAKIGFIISGKVGKANVRNRLRRVLAKYFYGQLEKLKKSQELIMIVHPIMAQATNEEINLNLNKILPKICL
jgi:ribonuclease P protein component